MRLRTAVIALTLASCLLPTDRSGSIQIEIPFDIANLLIGDTLQLTTRVLRDGVEIPNVELVYEVLDDNIAVASADGVILGVGEGQTTVQVSAATFDNATPASLQIFVSRGIVIVEIATEVTTEPNTARYGEELTLTGRRLDPDSLSIISIGAAAVDVAGYVPSDTTDPSSFEQLSIRVPFVPSPAELLLVHRNGGTAARTIQVLSEDVYDGRPQPILIDLTQGDFVNRDLSVTLGSEDHYRIITPPGDYTILAALRGTGSFGGADPEFAIVHPDNDPFRLDLGTGFRPPRRWGVEAVGVACQLRVALAVFAGSRFGSRLVLAGRRTTMDTLDFTTQAAFRTGVPYALEVRSGYHSDLPPDAFEANDMCRDAVELPPDGTVQSLNFDVATDIDWFNFTVGDGMQPPSFAVTVRDESEPNNTLLNAELTVPGERIVGDGGSGDIDYYAIDLTAGALLDVDVRAREAQLGNPTAPLFGRNQFTQLFVDAILHDSVGTQLVRSGTRIETPAQDRSVGTDARIRYVVPVTGRYYISITGSDVSGPGGPAGLYYGVDIMAHTVVGNLEITTSSSDPNADPDLLVIERRADQNVLLVRKEVGDPNTFTLPVPSGQFYVVFRNRKRLAAPYEATVRLLSP